MQVTVRMVRMLSVQLFLLLTDQYCECNEIFTQNEASLVSDDEQGLIDYRISGRPTKETTLLLKAMILGLEEMADDENYEKYIDLTFEEV